MWNSMGGDDAARAMAFAASRGRAPRVATVAHSTRDFTQEVEDFLRQQELITPEHAAELEAWING